MIKKFLMLFLLISAVVICPACGKRGLKGLVPAEGVVLYDGKPLEGASISLQPKVEGARSGSGDTDSQGKFRMWTVNPGDGVFPGEYTVLISKSIDLNPMTHEERLEKLKKDGWLPDIQSKPAIPIKYSSPATSGLEVSISEKGTKELKFELTSK